MLNNNRFANHVSPKVNNYTGDKDISVEDFEKNEDINAGSLLVENILGSSLNLSYRFAYDFLSKKSNYSQLCKMDDFLPKLNVIISL